MYRVEHNGIVYELTGDHVGYKGIIDIASGHICLVRLLYDHALPDPIMNAAYYTKCCYVARITDIVTNENLDECDGACCMPFVYRTGDMLCNKDIYFFSADTSESYAIDRSIAFAEAAKEGFGFAFAVNARDTINYYRSHPEIIEYFDSVNPEIAKEMRTMFGE